MSQVYFALEALGTGIVLILLYAALFEMKQHDPKRKAFIWLLVSNGLVISVDAVTWLSLDWARFPHVLAALISVSYIAPFAVQAIFALYLYVHVSQKVKTNKLPFQITIYASFIMGVVVTVLCLMGKMFEIRAGKYYPGPLEGTYFIFYLLSILYMTLLILHHCKKLGVHDTIAAMSFCIIPLVSIVLGLVADVSLSVTFMALDMLVIFITLQSDREHQLMDEGEAINRLAHHDDMTRLNNRRAYEKMLDSLTDAEYASVVFCDVNGLKDVNDTLGHRAGDELLIRFALILKQFFAEEEIFRISGDEFVILSRRDIESQYADMKKEITLNSDIASTGYASGEGVDILRLVSEAEKQMYDDKAGYYLRTGKDRRRKQ